MACTHQNTLLYFYGRTQCEACGQEISGGAYTCLSCNVWFHESCASKLLRIPDEIIHPLHSHHKLQLNLSSTWTFVCDKCLYISEGPRYYYSSSSCNFNLHLTCASSSANDPPPEDVRRKTKIQHYSHQHILKIFKYRKIKEECYCYWCEKRFSDSDICCGCILCKFFVHEVCINKIPRKLNHPFYPSHPLRLHLNNRYNDCNACGASIYNMTPYYGCETCLFRLDFPCSKLIPTLELKSHDDHFLTYFKKISWLYYEYRCNVCHLRCDADFYRCVQCDFNIHLQCLPFSSSAKHKYHRHPLILVNSVEEDDSDEYYCDVCEKKRNPKHPVYWCEKCKFIVHIECIIHEPSSVPQSMDTSKALVTRKELEDDIHTSQQLLIQPLIHEHPMKFHEVTENSEANLLYCNGCRLVLSGPSYICTSCPEDGVQQLPAYQKKYYLHEKCTKLAYEIIQHPFHPNHPLYFYPKHPASVGHIIVTCDECRDICLGFIYVCEECNFKLDVKCALTTTTTTVSQPKLNQMERVTELHHFNHPHKLILGNYSDPIRKIECSICDAPIFGPVYFCNLCVYICHESCLGLPQKLIQVPFHPDHSFVLHRFEPLTDELRCYACCLPYEILIEKSTYSCEECDDVKLHCICANSLRRSLKYDHPSHHLHHLYYFGTHCQLLFANYKHRFLCSNCKERCRGMPFYRCLQCGINFHLECVPIPLVVKSRYHFHPLKLKDSFIEDSSGEYYCDVCEEERFGKDHVYCCEECDDRFVAHIECVLAKVEEVISYLVPRQRKKSPIHVDSSSESDSSDDDLSLIQDEDEEEEEDEDEDEDEDDSTSEDLLEEVQGKYSQSH